MAFSMCKECGQFISGDVAACPNCGAAIEAKSSPSADATSSPGKAANTSDAAGSVTSTAASPHSSATSSPPASSGRVTYSAPTAVSSTSYYTMAPASRRRKGSMGKVIGIIIGAIVLVAAIGGGVIFFAMQQNSPENITARAQAAYDQGDYEEALSILETVDSATYPPAKLLLKDAILKQIDTLLEEGDYTAAFEYLDASEISDEGIIEDLYVELQYEAMAIQCIPDLLVNVPNPDSIEISEVLIYYPSQDSIDVYGKVFPKCFFVLKGQAENDELTYWEFGPNDTAMMFDYNMNCPESLLMNPDSTDDIVLYVTAMLMKFDLDASEPLFTSDGARIMTVIEKKTYKDIEMPDYMEMEDFEE